jgi:hypothetical protein
MELPGHARKTAETIRRVADQGSLDIVAVITRFISPGTCTTGPCATHAAHPHLADPLSPWACSRPSRSLGVKHDGQGRPGLQNAWRLRDGGRGWMADVQYVVEYD